MGLPPGSITKVKKACYGLVDAPLEWYRSISDYFSSLGLKKCWTDPCCWTLIHEGQLRGIITGHVDDFLFSGRDDDPVWQTLLKKIQEQYKWSEWESGKFVQCGVLVQQHDDGTYTLSQEKYAEELQHINIRSARRKEKHAPTDAFEKTQLRALLGGISWHAQQVAPHFSADVSLMLSEVNSSTVETLLRANQLLDQVVKSKPEKGAPAIPSFMKVKSAKATADPSPEGEQEREAKRPRIEAEEATAPAASGASASGLGLGGYAPEAAEERRKGTDRAAEGERIALLGPGAATAEREGVEKVEAEEGGRRAVDPSTAVEEKRRSTTQRDQRNPEIHPDTVDQYRRGGLANRHTHHRNLKERAGVARRKPATEVQTVAVLPVKPKGRKRFEDVNPKELLKVGPVVIEEGIYYGKTVAIAGVFQSFRSEGDQTFANLKVCGTKSEELLRLLTGKADKLVTIHLCDKECPCLVTDETLIHAEEFEEVDLNRVPWLTNLKGVGELPPEEDELQRLREEQARMEAEKKADERRKDKKEKRKKKKEEKEEGRVSKSPRKDSEALEVGQKSLEAVFRDTGMDPSPTRRAKIMKKARKVMRSSKKKKKRKAKSTSSATGSSSSTSTSSSPEGFEDGLYDDEERLHSVWRRYPGALTARSIAEIKRSLVTAAGTLWSMEKTSLAPLFTQYGRQVVLPGMSPALQQEALTLCQAIDLMIQGKVAASLDVLNQRFKSVVALSKGSHWTLGRQYELVRVEDRGFAEDGEARQAARRAKEDEKLKGLLMRPTGGKGADNFQGQGGKGKKGKETEGTNKGQYTDMGKNRGGNQGKDDKRRDGKRND
eukprot:s1760_g11.t1